MKIKILLVFVTVFLFSCSNAVREYDLQNIDKEIILEKYNNRFEGLKSISGKLTVVISDLQSRKQTTVDFNYIIPDTLYTEIHGAVGETEAVMFLAADSFYIENYYDSYKIYDKREGFSLKELFSLDLPLKTFLSSFTNSDEILNLNISSTNADKIVLKNENKKVILDKYLSPTEVYIFENGEVRYKKLYDYFSVSNGYRIAKRIRFYDLKEKQKLTVFYNNYSINDKEPVNFKRRL